MSDQQFKGLNPKSPPGKSIFFSSLDYWIGLCECIRMICHEGFPSYPSMEAEDAEDLAEMLARRREFGIIKAYFELDAARSFDKDGDSDGESEAAAAEYVETMLDWTRQYILFLRECGGCEAV